jgi:hypothetical protein
MYNKDTLQSGNISERVQIHSGLGTSSASPKTSYDDSPPSFVLDEIQWTLEFVLSVKGF